MLDQQGMVEKESLGQTKSLQTAFLNQQASIKGAGKTTRQDSK